MLRSMKDIEGYILSARDGQIGRCKDFLFEDQAWVVRYIVADTHKWLPGRKVLISPLAVGDETASTRRLQVDLTKEEIKASPPIDRDAPVSRQYEIAYSNHYAWPYYWQGSALWGDHAYPRLMAKLAETPRLTAAEANLPKEKDAEPNLRSVKEVTGYHIQARDTRIGHLKDLIMDDQSWTVRYLVIDTSNWLPASKKVLVASDWADLVDYRRRRVLVNLDSEQIEKSPEYDPSQPVNRELETSLYDFYGRPHYW